MMQIDEKFYDNFYYLDEATIMKYNESRLDPSINNVVVGLNEQCYGVGLKEYAHELTFQVLYINGRNELKGAILEIKMHDSNRENWLTLFCVHLADNFDLDIVDTFNTFQNKIRSLLELLGYTTMTSTFFDSLNAPSPTIVAKNSKGIFILHFPTHEDVFRYLFGPIEEISKNPENQYVYLMFNKRNKLIKIGRSIDPRHRERTLQGQEPEIVLLAFWKGDNNLEKELQKLFDHLRQRGEWFKLNFKELKNLQKYVTERGTDSQPLNRNPR